MSRLTDGVYSPIDNSKIGYTAQDSYKCIEKLGKLEDFEWEVGCPLEVVFKALTTSVWNDKAKRQEWVVLGYSNHEFVLKTTKELYIDDGTSILPLKEYGKTWGLTAKEIKE